MPPPRMSGDRFERWADEVTYPAELILSTHHLVAGECPPVCPDAGSWRILDESALLGEGRECYERAAWSLLNWRAHRRAGVGVGAWRGATVDDVVRVRFAGTDSPCLILCVESGPTATTMTYGTLPGHVECGEESFSVVLGSDGLVWGRIVAFSAHARWITRLGGGVARAVQTMITRRYLEGMRP
ncbi:DUF1990 domain-containing protein [Corynebacterium pygosceleis]|uniref:DUF1990 domain-containing protein n=2 Tax=Corynebacterium pygosceleis TaxID=2800406 RepID=A0A9Q4C7B9_9CORY|nr:DUF1990 domain-containing protein [Corynebacterium pygosceleis]MCK7637016.1 DUF1990 domain-containing protein [Corynebacterium pygosceleis]MCK7674490.1 DUF1990 domain-containing protein [Corynebacterium pygosceleis]MCX7467769.1 DUF1990 domain-containing protein [Corynebacterium pygosceleis]